MAKGKEVKEDERAFIVRMEKGGATILKIVEETKRQATVLRQSTTVLRQSATVLRQSKRQATILRKYRLR